MNLIIDGKLVDISTFDFRKFKKSNGISVSGEWDIICSQDNKMKWRENFKNLAVNEGLNNLLGVYFGAGTQSLSWYIGLIGTNSIPSATWTAAGIGTECTEFINYTGSNRLQWIPSAASGQSITNSANPAIYTMGGSGTIYGAFLINNNTLSGTSGHMYSASIFSVNRTVVLNDQLSITYVINISSS